MKLWGCLPSGKFATRLQHDVKSFPLPPRRGPALNTATPPFPHLPAGAPYHPVRPPPGHTAGVLPPPHLRSPQKPCYGRGPFRHFLVPHPRGVRWIAVGASGPSRRTWPTPACPGWPGGYTHRPPLCRRRRRRPGACLSQRGAGENAGKLPLFTWPQNAQVVSRMVFF